MAWQQERHAPSFEMDSDRGGEKEIKKDSNTDTGAGRGRNDDGNSIIRNRRIGRSWPQFLVMHPSANAHSSHKILRGFFCRASVERTKSPDSGMEGRTDQLAGLPLA